MYNFTSLALSFNISSSFQVVYVCTNLFKLLVKCNGSRSLNPFHKTFSRRSNEPLLCRRCDLIKSLRNYKEFSSITFEISTEWSEGNFKCKSKCQIRKFTCQIKGIAFSLQLTNFFESPQQLIFLMIWHETLLNLP